MAAARFNNADAMRLLLDAGADTKAQQTRTNLVTAAYFARTSAVHEVLASARVVVLYPADVKGPVLARNRDDVDVLNRLLEAGGRRRCELWVSGGQFSRLPALGRDG